MSKTEQETLAARIGHTIARRRAAANLTQEDVAEKLGLGSEAASRLERGVATLSVVRLFELSELFGCETADLLTEGSVRVDDQARQIQQLLSGLSGDDRELVLQLVKQVSERLAR
tara:strand:- start:576 stop:920 length:345 start_codon:yes stop_codon:yes gene_type:complete